jgi:PAS domain S-box-containing protein
VFATPNVVKNRGYSMEELRELPFETHLTAKSAERVQKLFIDGTSEKFFDGQLKELTMELEFKKKGGGTTWSECKFSVIRDNKGAPKAILGVARNVTDKKKAEADLKESEEKFRNLAEQSPNMIFINKRGHVVYANKKCEELMGYTRDEFYAPSFDFRNITAPEFRDVVMRAYQKHQAGQDVEPYEYAIIAKDGRRLTTILTPKLIRYEGEPAIMGIITDITERKKMEDAVNASLREKDALLREVHHRVKNNLQVICSLLSLQSRHITDQSALAAFKESESRVRSMALVHEKLYMTRDFGLIDFATYVRSLAPELLRSYKVEQDTVRLKMELDDVRLGIDVAIPLGMIMNELVSNCLKHAFPEGRKGEIAIELRSGPGGSVTLSVRDDGVGFSDGVDFRSVKSMGMEMVSTLVEQLEGRIEMERTGGTKFTVRFSPSMGTKEAGPDVR